jgi:uncharacterized cupin superfamily protein
MAQRLRSPALDPQTVPARRGSNYPAPFRAEVESRQKRPLGDALGLSQFGVNLVLLPPGCWSSQRPWHTHEDEFVYVLEGELTLVTDAGEQLLRPGAAAGFPAGKADGHHLINRTDRPATYLEVGTRRDDVDEVDYSDIDMAVRHRDGAQVFVRKNGEPYGPATLPHQARPRREETT